MAGGAYPVPPGPSILDKLWAEMDHQLGKLMALDAVDFPHEEAFELASTGQKGMCLGIAKCLAIMLAPYDPDVDAVRAEAMERWEARRS